MSVVNVTNIRLGNNPSPICAPFVFEICFEALTPLKEDIEWRVVYVGSAECDKKARKSKKEDRNAAVSSSQGDANLAGEERRRADGDMEVEEEDSAKRKKEEGGDYLLDSVMLGPIERGVLAFEFAVNAPDYTKVRRHCSSSPSPLFHFHSCPFRLCFLLSCASSWAFCGDTGRRETSDSVGQ
ncbi:hypothetical protein NCLIV_003550 [Neospora caninum Liverpool]|uniref:Uncharacterized protein n=1 Tax=Neospora caninum (strain Liverpool) TaxID=572307 RepID=F0V829_NEOCL|nr:hypothetical protein NCLIV_003550 [Neospora caninum Liverpool]CBZ49870.1 hypothetical protein NCLIV_003550 [Neospora caninum Liverpool]|eukprot:XP_003879905.1 hypothetical protein NCLIV_003550 [Neospora caninum Liverpool]